MSENRTEKATPKKIREARQQGNVAQSNSLISALMFLAILLIFSSTGPAAGRMLMEFGRKCWSTAPAAVDNDGFIHLWREMSGSFLGLFIGVILCAAILPVLGGLVQRGWLFLPKKMLPDFTRVFSGDRMGKLFSLESLWRLTDGILKTALCIGALWFFWRGMAQGAGFPDSADTVPRLLWNCWFAAARWLGFALLIFSGMDLLFRRWKWNKDLMMTPEEIRREQEEAEGKPEVRAVRNDLLRSSRRRDR